MLQIVPRCVVPRWGSREYRSGSVPWISPSSSPLLLVHCLTPTSSPPSLAPLEEMNHPRPMLWRKLGCCQARGSCCSLRTQTATSAPCSPVLLASRTVTATPTSLCRWLKNNYIVQPANTRLSCSGRGWWGEVSQGRSGLLISSNVGALRHLRGDGDQPARGDGEGGAAAPHSHLFRYRMVLFVELDRVGRPVGNRPSPRGGSPC